MNETNCLVFYYFWLVKKIGNQKHSIQFLNDIN